MNFFELSDRLIAASEKEVSDMSSMVALFTAFLSLDDIEFIDLGSLQLDELIHFKDTIFEIIAEEDDYGELLLNQQHPFTRLLSLQHKMSFIEDVQKERVPSTYRFI